MGMLAFLEATKRYAWKFFKKTKQRLQCFCSRRSRRGGDEFIYWGLGVEQPFFFSSKFPIKSQTITISGSQTTHNGKWPVKYSIIKMNNFGTSIEYFDSVVYYGDYPEGKLHHTFYIPNGQNYQL